MGIDVVTMEDCASNYGIFEVIGSKGDTYEVTFNGSEGPSTCHCKGFQYSGEKQTCRHIKQVWEQACLFNPPWHDGKKNPTLRPKWYTYNRFSGRKCPCCGGPMVYVKRAV